LAGLQGQQQHLPFPNAPLGANNIVNPKGCPTGIRPNGGFTKPSNLGNCSGPNSSATTTVVHPRPNNAPIDSGAIHTNNINNNCAAGVNPNGANTKVVHSDNCPTNKNGQITVNPGNSASSTASSSSSSLTINNLQGSNSESSSISSNRNTIPIANAGANQKVHSPDRVVLDGSKSSNPSTRSLKFSWLQIAGGPVISLSNHDKSKTTFVVSSVPDNTILTFQLIVNNRNAYSAPSYVTVTVQP
jgi:hypothetical protein